MEDVANPDALAQVREAHDHLMNAFVAGTSDEYFDCFHEEASFVFAGEALLQPRSAYRSTWDRWQREGVRFTDAAAYDIRVRVVGDTAVVTHRLRTTVIADGIESVDRERESIVFSRVGGRWLALHEHLSAEET
jgi:ketosteroid isomerase-like protein